MMKRKKERKVRVVERWPQPRVSLPATGRVCFREVCIWESHKPYKSLHVGKVCEFQALVRQKEKYLISEDSKVPAG